MDQDHRHNLWSLFTLLLNVFITGMIILSVYILLKNQIDDFIDKPKYSKEQLVEIADRSRLLRIQKRNDNWNLIENGIHVNTGLKADKNIQLIIGSCTSCHSAKLITQNRATRSGWKSMIRWMQETQGLTDLGSNETIILDYLAKHYAPKQSGRRQNLDLKEVEWYILNLDKNGG